MVARWATLLLLLLLLLVQAGLWLGEGGLSHARQLAQTLATQQAGIAAQKQQNTRLQAEVDDLKSGLEMVEERARSELGMVKPNEIFVQYAGAARR
jgi:cell division protein FtsB